MKLFESTNIPLLGKALNAYSKRHQAIAVNIANINTVGYTPQRVSFDEELSGAMRNASVKGAQTNPLHMPIVPQQHHDAQLISAETENGSSSDLFASGMNNVDIDQEMAELAKNQIRFKFAARLIADTFKGIQKSIRGQSV